MHRTWMIIFLLLGFAAMHAQTVEELEKERKSTLQRLETSTKILGQTQKSKKVSLNKLNVLSRNIKQRTNLINNINTEIRLLDRQMNRLTSEKLRLEKKLTELKQDYADMIREAYKNRSLYTKLMFVLSSENFDQSWRRLRYIQEFSNYRKQQAEQIIKTQQQIAEKTEKITDSKFKKIEVVNQKRQETRQLTTDKKKESSVLTDLQKKEKNLKSEISRQKKKAQELDNRIASIIAEEIRKSEEKQQGTKAKEGTAPAKSSGSKSEYAMTKEEKLISGNFEKNKGRLPWPVEKGFISGRFGIHSHPVLKYVTTNNKGIYLQTEKGADARAVFDGVVTQSFSVPGSNWGVIIKHGNYRTVYANLTDIYVKVGQKISTKQKIGRIYTDREDDDKTELYFQVWESRNILNPESWISR